MPNKNYYKNIPLNISELDVLNYLKEKYEQLYNKDIIN